MTMKSTPRSSGTGENMSCDKWNWKPICDTRKCPGDCDSCGYDDEDPEEVNYTATRNTDRIQAQPMCWEEFDDDL